GAGALLAVDEDVAARLLYDAVHRRQAETRTLADALRGEEGLEDLAAHVRAHAGAGVLHLDEDVLAFDQAFLAGDLGFALAVALGDVAVADGDGAAVWHRVLGVDGEIDHDLIDLRLVGLDVPEVAGRRRLEFDLL